MRNLKSLLALAALTASLTFSACQDRGSLSPSDPTSGPGTEPGAPFTPPPVFAVTTPSCLASGTGPLVTLSGAKSRYDVRTTTVSNERFDATTATWTGTTDFPVEVGNGKTTNVCWHGGKISGTWATSTPWSTYHSTAGLFMGGPDFTVEDATVSNYGDAIRWEDTTNNWTLRRFHVVGAHDDCVENDRIYAGLIDDSYFEGCYVFLSERPGGGVNVPTDPTHVVTIRNSLVWLKPMPTVYTGVAPGNGPLWKWSTAAGPVADDHVVFRIDQKPSHGDYKFPPKFSCLNSHTDTLVWLGAGAYPYAVPSCVKVVTNKAVWDNAVAAWTARRQ